MMAMFRARPPPRRSARSGGARARARAEAGRLGDRGDEDVVGGDRSAGVHGVVPPVVAVAIAARRVHECLDLESLGRNRGGEGEDGRDETWRRRRRRRKSDHRRLGRRRAARADEASRRGRSVADLFVVLDAFALAPLEEALKRRLPFLERHDAGRRPEMMALREERSSQEQLTTAVPRGSNTRVYSTPPKSSDDLRLGVAEHSASHARAGWASALSTPCSGSPPRVSSAVWPWPRPRPAPTRRTDATWPRSARRCASRPRPSISLDRLAPRTRASPPRNDAVSLHPASRARSSLVFCAMPSVHLSFPPSVSCAPCADAAPKHLFARRSILSTRPARLPSPRTRPPEEVRRGTPDGRSFANLAR